MSSSTFVPAVALLAVFLVAVAACPSYAELLPIDNPGFEIPVLADDDYDYSMDNEGWGYFDNGGNQGSWNVTTADYPGQAPQGQNVGWTNPGDAVPGGFAQVLTDANATLKEGMRYTLSVEVGNSVTYPSGGYKVQLLAGGTPHTPGTGGDYTGPVTGGTLLAEDNNSLTIPAGTFKTSVVTYTYDPAQSSLLGQRLQIRLLALPGGGDAETEFDNVRLDAVPEPGTLVLMSMGAVALLAYASRRRRGR